jgi:hypothetical protein
MKKSEQSTNPPIVDKQSKYNENCIKLYKKMRYPDKSLIVRPPLKQPPHEMLNDFIQNGLMPITKYWYFDNAYTDSNSENTNGEMKNVYKQLVDTLKQVRANAGLPNYGDKNLNKLMHLYASEIAQKSLAVIGTEYPWVEAIAYDIGASSITTLDYTRKTYGVENLHWYHVNDYLEDAMESQKLEHFGTIASFSSIEHSGLGRYGDPLSPYGDVDAVRQVHCMLRPGGLFFLALPVSDDNSSYIEFNAHRVYGTARLKLLFNGWQLLHREKETSGFHGIFVLRKISEY